MTYSPNGVITAYKLARCAAGSDRGPGVGRNRLLEPRRWRCSLRPKKERSTEAKEGLCRLPTLDRLPLLHRISPSSMCGGIEPWECDRLSKQLDRDAMEFVLVQTRRRARLFLLSLVLCSSTSSPDPHLLLACFSLLCLFNAQSGRLLCFPAANFVPKTRSSPCRVQDSPKA